MQTRDWIFGAVAGCGLSFLFAVSHPARADMTLSPPARAQGRTPASTAATASRPTAPTTPAPATSPRLKGKPLQKAPQQPPYHPAAHVVSKPYPFQQSVIKKNNFIRPTQIVGCCAMLNTHARIETLDGRFVKDEQITTFETFGVNGLTPGVYNMIFIHPRYKVPLRMEKVRTGLWIQFNSP